MRGLPPEDQHSYLRVQHIAPHEILRSWFSLSFRQKCQTLFEVEKVSDTSATALIIGVEDVDWDTLALQTNPSFWHMIEQRRSERTIPLETMRRPVNRKNA